ncbi:hypothetical protein EFW17_19430 [Halostreptopolyspora alba]|uniref:DUF1023 domain-containing protein n=2 Tax=Halostreptopolyspora alba TaxID=2487137 RepID=A0A3N0E3Z9_9ACTN|nr:hypothetical protein EFW17_19430 [Nocardiopsaceae bacterium YIM 96095]
MGDTAFDADPALWDGENGGPQTSNVLFGFGDDDPELAPDPDAAPDEVNDWWEELSEDEREEVMEQEPEHIRDLDGIPSDVRHDLNQDFLEEETQRRLEEEGLTREEALEIDSDADDELVELRELVKLEETLNGDDGDDYYLLALDPEEERSIVSRGNPDTADNVSTLVPGTGIGWEAMNGQLGRAESLHEAASAADRGSDHASIAWIGYDTPNWVQAASDWNARGGRDELIGFQDGLRATHEGEPSNNTVIGHSYGSTVVGGSAQSSILGGEAVDADNLILTGSPGAMSNNVEELDVDPDNVHTTRSEDDEVVGDVLAWAHGTDVTSGWYGANVFESEPGTGHSDYFDDPQSGQMRYMGEVIAGER